MTIRVQAAFQHDSGLAEDQMINTWYMRHTAGVLEAEIDNFMDGINAFYTDLAPGQTAALMSHYSNELTGDVEYRAYDLSTPPPRVPINERTENYAAGIPNAVPHPSEVALCLSFRGAYASGANRARRRGRVYLGPFASNTGAEGEAERSRPTSVVLNNVVSAAAGLLSLSEAAGGFEWVVFSETTPGTADFPVVGGWVDNAWDTQRRRGARPLVRSEFGLGD